MHIRKTATFGAIAAMSVAATVLALPGDASSEDLTNSPRNPLIEGKLSGERPAVDLLSLKQRQARFMGDHPGVMISELTESRRIAGKKFGGGATPRAAADAFVQDQMGMFGVPAADLRPGSMLTTRAHRAAGDNTQPVMYDRNTGFYKFTAVYYTQQRDGVDVYGANVVVLVKNEPGNPIVLVNPDTRELGDFVVDRGVQRQAGAPMRTAIKAAFGQQVEIQPTREVIWAGASVSDKVPARLARVSYVINDHDKWEVVTDAETGEILHQNHLICFGGVSGNVSGVSGNGPGADICDTEVPTPMPYLQVNSGANSTFTDANGDYTLPGGNPTVDATLVGEWFEIFDFVIAEATESTPASTPADLLFNAANSDELIRAQINAYIHSNIVRDFVLQFNPAYPTLGLNQFEVNTNRTDGFCPGNAWYDPLDNGGNGSINFCQAGPSNPNTAWTSVVYHEYGHHLVNAAGSGQGQYGEGMGDVMSELILDDPRLGLGFFNDCGSELRNPVTNFRSYPCSGSSHDCGQLISGCVWDTRLELDATEGANAINVIGNLAVNAMLVHTGSSIDPSITTDYLVLDDDNGDLSDGTPHSDEINAGFGAHNMAPIDPPANDNCNSAEPVCPGTVTGTTIGANNDGGSSCGNSSTSSDVWYSYRPDSNGTLGVSLCSGTSYDSVISVHSGCPGTGANEIACDDDGCGPTGGPSSLSVPVTAGETYFIRVTGWDGAVGNFSMDITGPNCLPEAPLDISYPNGVPEIFTPEVSNSFMVNIDENGESYQSGSAMLNYRTDGGAFAAVALNDLGGGSFEAIFPAASCGEAPEFFISASTTVGSDVTEPADAPTSARAVALGTVMTVMDDNFETDLGWTTENLGATSGDWQRGLPVNDTDWAYDPVADADGSGQCYLTQNQIGNTDVDNGAVRLISPTFDMSGGGASIAYEYYLRLTDDNGADRMIVDISSNGTAGPWTQIALHNTDGLILWREHSISPTDLANAGVTLTSNMAVRFTVNDADTQSIVEAGVDAFTVQAVACEVVAAPCPWDCAPPGGNGTVNFDDMLEIINAISTQNLDCDVAPDNGDGTFGNGTVNFDDLLETINAFGDCPGL